jgi:hypothetical protein
LEVDFWSDQQFIITAYSKKLLKPGAQWLFTGMTGVETTKQFARAWL